MKTFFKNLSPLEELHLSNKVLKKQFFINQLNNSRPDLYIYTDFGGDKNCRRPLIDLQTCQKIASAGWKATLQQRIYFPWKRSFL